MQVIVRTNETYDPTRHVCPPAPVTKTIDWNNASDRKWLTNHLHWAVNNGQEVTIIPPAPATTEA